MDTCLAEQKNASCPVCGMPLSGQLSIRAQDGCICENCFLDRGANLPPWETPEQPYVLVAEALAAALDAREHETGLHSKRVACHTMVLAKHFSSEPELLRQVYWGALLHDVGKIGIPDAILLKQGALVESEWQVMRRHPEIGHRILAVSQHMAMAAEIVLCHEERFDGSGYPRGLRGGHIPIWARLFAVIDTLDAMTSDRPYRKGVSFDDAKNEIGRLAGLQFDPMAVETFFGEEKTMREMVMLKCSDASMDYAGG